MFEAGNSPEQPKMTVREARKLLGRKYGHLSDYQVQEIINTLTLVARKSLNL